MKADRRWWNDGRLEREAEECRQALAERRRLVCKHGYVPEFCEYCHGARVGAFWLGVAAAACVLALVWRWWS